MKNQNRFSLIIISLLGAAFVLVAGLKAAGQSMGVPARQRGHGDAVERPPAEVGTASQPWIEQIVDMPCYTNFTSDHSLQYDSAGHLHLAFGGDRLRYATFNGASWQVEIVDDAIGTGMGASLALDADDRPHIAYVDVRQNTLKYAHWDGSAWQRGTLDGAWGYSERTAIAVDATGRPHIAYKKYERIPPGYTCPYMGYAHWTGSQWQLEQLDVCGKYVSLALDSSGAPHLSFAGNVAIKHATKLNGNWQITDVGASNLGYGSSIAVDSHDNPHVAYIDDEVDGQLIYAVFNGSEWTPTPVAPAEAGLNVSLVLDDTDKAHIAHFNQYFTVNGDQSDLVESVTAIGGSYNAIAVDGAHGPAISYSQYSFYNKLGFTVFCRRLVGEEWVSDVVHDGGEAGLGNSIAVGASGAPHITYYGDFGFTGGARVQYAGRSDTGWQTETITMTYMPEWPRSDYRTSLALDSHDDPHVAYWYSDYYESGLYYGRRTGDEWHIEQIADGYVETGRLVLDSLDRPHIAFADYPGFMVGYRSESGWVLEDVADELGDPSSLTLALDALDRPHLVYTDWFSDSQRLRYATWNGSEWRSSVIDTLELGDGYGSPSMALDATGKVHITFQIFQSEQSVIRYATGAHGDWTFETVDVRRWSTSELAIVLDKSDNPSIVYSYRPVSDQGVHVARRVDDAWLIEQVVTASPGEVSAASDGYSVYVAYQDVDGQALMVVGPPTLTEKVYLPVVNGN